ncbi:MAG: hypothetical protein H7839_02130 [Magnetococcus sp. YQC-5]
MLGFIPIQPFPPVVESGDISVLFSAEEWNEDRKALDQLSRDGNWPEALKILKRLLTKHKNTEIYKALAQRIWVGLKTQTSAILTFICSTHFVPDTKSPRPSVPLPI